MPKSLKDCVPADKPAKAAVDEPKKVPTASQTTTVVGDESKKVQTVETPALASGEKPKKVPAGNKPTKEQDSQRGKQSTESTEAETKTSDKTGRHIQ